jgi:hypothetical protein
VGALRLVVGAGRGLVVGPAAGRAGAGVVLDGAAAAGAGVPLPLDCPCPIAGRTTSTSATTAVAATSQVHREG